MEAWRFWAAEGAELGGLNGSDVRTHAAQLPSNERVTWGWEGLSLCSSVIGPVGLWVGLPGFLRLSTARDWLSSWLGGVKEVTSEGGEERKRGDSCQ